MTCLPLIDPFCLNTIGSIAPAPEKEEATYDPPPLSGETPPNQTAGAASGAT